MCMHKYGWSSAFYIPAIIGLITASLWFFIVYNTPAEHPWITEKEVNYIEDSLQDSVVNEKVFSFWHENVRHNLARISVTFLCCHLQKAFPPILQILKSRPFWAVMMLNYGNMWAFFFFLTVTPSYLRLVSCLQCVSTSNRTNITTHAHFAWTCQVLHFNLQESGFLGSLPYLCRFLSGFLFSALGDWLIKRNICRVITIRRYFCITCKCWLFVCVCVDALTWNGRVTSLSSDLCATAFSSYHSRNFVVLHSVRQRQCHALCHCDNGRAHL